MSRKKWEKLEKEYAEAIKFQDVLKTLQFESIGEFVELIGGLMGMVNVNDIDNAKKISEAFALRIGYILDKIDYVDKVIDKNKSMRDFYEEQQQKMADQEEAKKQAGESEEPAPTKEEQFAKEYDDYLRTGEVEGELNLKAVEIDEKVEDQIEDQVTNIMGRNPWEAGLSDEEKEAVAKSEGNTIEPAMTLQLDPTLLKNIKQGVTAKHVGAGWYELSSGERIRGKNNLPENVVIEA